MSDIIHDEEYIKLKSDFDVYYTEKLAPVLQKSEKVRYRYLTAFAVLVCMGLFFYPTILAKLFNSDLHEDDSMIGIVLGLSCLVIMVMCGPLYVYKQKVKPQIMPDFADFFGSFMYQYEGKIDDLILRQSDLFEQYNQSVGDDTFVGVYDGV